MSATTAVSTFSTCTDSATETSSSPATSQTGSGEASVVSQVADKKEKAATTLSCSFNIAGLHSVWVATEGDAFVLEFDDVTSANTIKEHVRQIARALSDDLLVCNSKPPKAAINAGFQGFALKTRSDRKTLSEVFQQMRWVAILCRDEAVETALVVRDDSSLLRF